MKTLTGRLLEAKGRPSGFDYIRLVLATGVILQHTINTSYGQGAATAMFRAHGLGRVVFEVILPMFFALSGFLVAGSLERNASLISFLGLRAIRLVPALGVEITLSALILGPICTSLTLSHYYSDPLFSHYFLNILGDIHYILPGVFDRNPLPGIVNGQLWTIPWELKCYVALAATAFVGVVRRKRGLLILLGLAQVALLAFAVIKGRGINDVIPGPVLVGCFLVGVTLYRFRSRVVYSKSIMLVATTATIALLVVPFGDWLLPLPASYMTVYLGLMNPPRHKALLSGDYSYGLYLYGFPIQQFIARFSWTHTWWLSFLLAYPSAFLVAHLSWWLVEKPAMNLKTLIYRAENRSLRIPAVQWHSHKIFSMRDLEPRQS